MFDDAQTFVDLLLKDYTCFKYIQVRACQNVLLMVVFVIFFLICSKATLFLPPHPGGEGEGFS